MPAVLPRTLFLAQARTTSGWYRAILPALALEVDWAGYQGEPPALTFPVGLSRSPVDLEALAGYEAVVIQQPAGVPWLRVVRELQAAGTKVLYEIDDYVHAVRKTQDHDFRGAFDRKRVEAYELVMGAADGLICSTPWLAARYRSINPRTWVCRNGIDLARYDLGRPSRPTVNIGWAGATGHRDAMQAWLPAVGEVMRERRDTRFVTVGQGFAEQLAPVVGAERVQSIPFAPLETYPAAMTHFDVALAPGGRSNFYRGKSDLRWLEASALGIPLIADPDVYPEIEHGVTGFHARTPGEVREQLTALVADAPLRARVGEAARAYVAEHRDARTMAREWVAALAAATARPEELAV